MRRLLLAVLLVAGCGGADAEPEALAAQEAVRAAASATATLTSYRTELVSEVDGRVVLRAQGEQGLDPFRSRTVFTVPEDVRAEAEALPGAGPVPGDGRVEQRYVAGVLYVTDPDQGGWTSTAVESPAPATGAGGDLLSGLAEAGEVEPLGREDVRGVATSRYRGRFGTPEVSTPIEVWIDDDGFPRRLVFGDDEGQRSTLELFDLGVEVVVEAPPADQVRPEDPS